MMDSNKPGGVIQPAQEDTTIVDDEQGKTADDADKATAADEATVADEATAADEVAGADETKEAAPDPREAPRRGLPAGRREPEQPRPRPIVVDAVDETVLALAHRVVELAGDKKASDIVLLDVRGQTTMTDYFVICSGASDRQLNAIADGIISGMKDEDDGPASREGDAGSHWLLVDFGGVIVHVMSKPEREFYQLEKLWSEAALLLHIV
jgi:ribosome-associated protein